MQKVSSRDGTSVAFWRDGTGPALLLVHGATADHTTISRFIGPAFAERFSVYAMDRRGRGGSGDSAAYDLEREAEDIAAVIDSIGEPVNVFGHSYGGLCALEAALLTKNVQRLVLYEGVPWNGEKLYPPGFIDHCQALLDAGDVDGMLLAVFRDLVHMPPAELELLRSHREAWAVRLGNARTLPREMNVESKYVFLPQRFAHMSTPTLLLVGGESPSHELDNARMIAEALPNARVAILPGQQHIAVYTAPDLVVREVAQFIEQ